ncbi:hypothetical protein Tco_0259887 [Tanacetum coccineum]
MDSCSYPYGKIAIGSKWVFRNKKDEHGTTTKNKARLVAQGSLVKTPMVPPNNLGPNLASKLVNETSYRGMIGSLRYLTTTRSDIQFFIVLCVRYQSNPKESHLIVVKRILSTVVAFDPFPSTDEPKKCPLKEFLIKFSVLNWRSSTGLNYNNGKYVDHPTPEVLGDLSHVLYNCATGSGSPLMIKYLGFPPPEGLSVSFLLWFAKQRKGIISYCFNTLLSQRALRLNELSLRREKAKSKRPPLRQGYHHPSQQRVLVTTTHPQDSGVNKQPLDRDTTSTTPNEGSAKTTSRPKGSLGEKDSGGNIPPADMEPIHTPVAEPSGTSAKYQIADHQDDKKLELPQQQDQPVNHLMFKNLLRTHPGPFNRITEKQWEQHEEAAVSYVDLKASIDHYYDVKHCSPDKI